MRRAAFLKRLARGPRTAALGHEERLPPTRLSAGYGFRKETIAGARHNERDAPRAAIRPTWNRGSNAPFRRHASHVAPYAIPASTSRCSANSLFIQSITARTQAARRRSRWTMIQYSAAISGIGRVSRSSSGWPSPT